MKCNEMKQEKCASRLRVERRWKRRLLTNEKQGNDLCSMHKGLAHFFVSDGIERGKPVVWIYEEPESFRAMRKDKRLVCVADAVEGLERSGKTKLHGAMGKQGYEERNTLAVCC